MGWRLLHDLSVFSFEDLYNTVRNYCFMFVATHSILPLQIVHMDSVQALLKHGCEQAGPVIQMSVRVYVHLGGFKIASCETRCVRVEARGMRARHADGRPVGKGIGGAEVHRFGALLLRTTRRAFRTTEQDHDIEGRSNKSKALNQSACSQQCTMFVLSLSVVFS